MVELERRGFYLVPEKREHRVVQVTEIDGPHLSLIEPETGTHWTVNREHFEQRLRDGYIQRVTPRWEPAGEAVTAEA